MLFVWLFALASGIVNACARYPASPDAAAAEPEHAAANLADRGTGDASPVADACHSKLPAERGACAKFCNDEAAGVWNAKLPYEPAVIAGVVVQTVPADLDDGLAAWRCSAAVLGLPRLRVPISIAFLRLTR